MRSILKKLRALGRQPDVGPVCCWAGEHSGEPICFLEIRRECGHVELEQPACLAHVQGMLRTGGVAERPAPCYVPDCDVVSIARISATADIPERRLL